MTVLVAFAGLVMAVHALVSAIALWLAERVRRARRRGEPVEAGLAELPPHHLEVLATYSAGFRGRIWQMAIIAMLAALLALISGHPAAIWLLGVSILIDCLLFTSFPGRQAYIAHASNAERIAELAQGLILLATMAALLVIFARTPAVAAG